MIVFPLFVFYILDPRGRIAMFHGVPHDVNTDQLRDALAAGRPTFYLGDVNVDAMRQDTPICRRYMRVLNDLGLQQLVTEPTHPEPTPTLLYHIITDVDQLHLSVSVLYEHISDHLTT